VGAEVNLVGVGADFVCADKELAGANKNWRLWLGTRPWGLGAVDDLGDWDNDVLIHTGFYVWYFYMDFAIVPTRRRMFTSICLAES